MKFCVQLLLVSGLLLSSFQSQSAESLLTDLSEYASPSLNGEICFEGSERSLSPPNSATETLPERSQSTSKFVTVEGTRLHFIIKGAGRPVVLIHGNPGSGQDWTHLF